jgi:hypothetical protein
MVTLWRIEGPVEDHFENFVTMMCFQDWSLNSNGGTTVWTIEPSAKGQGMSDE